MRAIRARAGCRGGSQSHACISILLRVEVLLAAVRAPAVLAQLEAAVDAVVRPTASPPARAAPRTRAARRAAGTRAGCPACSAKDWAGRTRRTSGLRQLGEVLRQLRLRVAPGEVRVRLREAELGERYITFGRVNASDRKIDVGVRRLHVGDHPLPEARTAWCADCRRGRCGRRDRSRTGRRRVSSSHSAAPVLASRSRTDRCPGTSSAGSRRTGSCRRGACRNHSGMLCDVRMIGRALERDVERDLDAELARAPARSRRSRRACRAPGASRCGRPRCRRSPTDCPDRPASAVSALLRPLRMRPADRMDRRQIDDVEAQRGDRVQPRRGVGKCRAATGLRA